jgi:hydrogenase maturation protease
MNPKLLVVIGCGNPTRGDDGVGPEVIARLRATVLPDDMQVHDAGTDGMAVLYRARGASHLVIVDAMAPSGAPGAIYNVPGELLETLPPSSINLHEFRWNHALYAGRRIYGEAFPPAVRVLLIESQSLDLSLELSDAVSRAASQVCSQIRDLADDFASGRWTRP